MGMSTPNTCHFDKKLLLLSDPRPIPATEWSLLPDTHTASYHTGSSHVMCQNILQGKRKMVHTNQSSIKDLGHFQYISRKLHFVSDVSVIPMVYQQPQISQEYQMYHVSHTCIRCIESLWDSSDIADTSDTPETLSDTTYTLDTPDTPDTLDTSDTPDIWTMCITDTSDTKNSSQDDTCTHIFNTTVSSLILCNPMQNFLLNQPYSM